MPGARQTLADIRPFRGKVQLIVRSELDELAPACYRCDADFTAQGQLL